MNQTIELLESIDFGSSTAEGETKNLQQYFVDTRMWRNLSNDKYDIILGAKGSGKSALYLNLIHKKEEFAQRGIVIVEAENPRGDTVFELLNNATRNDKYESPNKEALIQEDVIDFWKLYFLTVAIAKLQDTGFKGKNFKVIRALLESAGLLPKTFSLNGVFNNVLHFLRQVVSLQFFQPEVEVNPTTGSFTVKGKVTFEKYTAQNHDEGYNTLDELWEKLNLDLLDSNQTIWLVIDRLDVAFIEDKELERRALKSLFLVYNSLKRFDQVRCKIFLRDDIMMKITYDGLREASHLTDRMIKIVVDERTLFNIMMKRLLNNGELLNLYKINKDECLVDVQQQQQFFSKVFPKEIKNQHQTMETFAWIVAMISDGNDLFTPRELIQLLNQAKERQIELLEQGHKSQDDYILSDNAMKLALRDVSEAKFQQTLVAENPDLTDNFLKFKNAPASVTADWLKENLKDIYGKPIEDIDPFATRLADIGFLKRIKEGEWLIPDVYQYALGIGAVQ